MINHSFEDGWEDLSGEAQEPHFWVLDWSDVGDPLLAQKAGNGDTQTHARCTPECVHKPNHLLPEDEQLGGDDALVLDGVYTYKLFGNDSYRVTLTQEFNTPVNAECNIIVPVQVHGHYNEDGELANVDTGAAYWRVITNGYPHPWNTYNNDFQDRTWLEDGYSFTSPYGTTTIQIEFECHTLGGVDFFVDNIQFSVVDAPQQPTNTIPEGGYDKEYWIVRDEILLERRDEIYSLAGIEQKTCGPSADDARAWATELCDLGRNVKAVPWDIPEAEKQRWRDYFADREPRIEVEFRGVTVPPPVDPPPTGGEPEPIQHYSGNFVGLHSALLKEGWREYVRDAKPTLMKTFSCGDTLEAKAANPQMMTVWRKHIGNDGSYLEGDIKANMQSVVDLYAAEVQTHHNNTGIAIPTILEQVDVMEGLNETYPTFNTDHILRAVDADLWFSELLNTEFGGAVKAGIFTAAVGNPHESEFELLLPLAKESHEGRARLGYHGYWAADPNQSYLIEHAPYHALRWQEMDKVFNAAGYYPEWYLGECGICYTFPESHGWSFVPTRGWKSCGPFSDYIFDIEHFNNLIDIWNAVNQGRCYGGTLFAYGGWGWENFTFEPGDLAELGEAMKVYA